MSVRAAVRVRTLLLVCLAVFAFTASATAVASPLTNLDITLLVQSQSAGGPLLLVAGQLPENTELPAEIVLPVPEGAKVVWSGEILGASTEEDVPIEATVQTRDGADVVVMTLTRSRVAQVELTFEGATVAAADGSVAAGFDIVSPVAAESTRIAIGLPSGAQPASLPEGTLSAQGPEGLTYYYLEPGAVTPGSPLALSMSYTQAAAPAASGAAPGQSGSADVPPLVIALIAAAMAGAVVVLLASRSRKTAGDTEQVQDGGFERASENATEGPANDDDLVEPHAPVSQRSWLTPQRLVAIIGVLVVGIIAAVILGGQQGQVGVTESSGGWISQRISTASAESTADFNTFISCDCPPEAEAPKMFDTLRSVPGVAHAALEEATLLLRVQYDPALTNEGVIGQALKAAGHVR